MSIHDVVSVLCVLLASALTALGFAVRSVFNNRTQVNGTLQRIATQLEVLNTGASQGAREGLALVNRRVDELDEKTDEILERHNSLALSAGIVADRINGHIRTPNTHAHGPAV